MKKILFAFIAMALAIGANAQDAGTTTLNVAVNIGTANSGYKLAFGADLEVDHSVASTLKITGSVGYENFHWSEEGESGNNGYIPILAGAKINFGDSKAYGHAQLGYSVGTKSGMGGAFAYAPSIGYYFSNNFDASVKYLAFSKNGGTLGTFGLRLAYTF